jgi:hypothetical protein
VELYTLQRVWQVTVSVCVCVCYPTMFIMKMTHSIEIESPFPSDERNVTICSLFHKYSRIFGGLPCILLTSFLRVLIMSRIVLHVSSKTYKIMCAFYFKYILE